jgi:MFS family permease
MTFLTYGIGMFVGSLICGRIVDMYATPGPGRTVLHNWRNIWMVPAVGAAMVLLIFWVGFRNEDRAADAPVPKGEVVSTSSV